MLSYRDVTFTQELIDEVTETVNGASDDQVISYIKRHPSLKAGGRLQKSCCPLFRKKILQHIRAMKDLDDEAAEFLYETGLGQSFVVVLSYDALKNLLYEFSSVFGRPAFALALVLDSRDTVRELGRELSSSQAQLKPADDARKEIGETLCRFSSIFSGFMPESVAIKHVVDEAPPAAVSDSDLLRNLKTEQRRNEELSRRIKADRDSFDRKLEVKDSRIDSLLAELEQHRRELALVRDEARRSLSDLERERAERDASIEIAVNNELGKITNRWLREREQVDRFMLSTDMKEDLIVAAEQFLVRQAQADRHTGNRRQLRERRSILSAKLAEIRDANISSFHPVNGFEELESSMVEEIHHISALLEKEDTARSPLVQALASRISTTKEVDLRHLEELCAELNTLGLSPADMLYLQHKLCVRYDRIVARYGNHVLSVQPVSPALRFRAALAAGRPVMLFCDGHNMLNSMEQFREACSRRHSEGRDCLIDTIGNLIRGYDSCQGYIVFDGPDHNREGALENLTVIYSGGGKNEKHRADKRIEEMLNWYEHAGNGEQVFVVSADQEVAKDARTKGAEIIPLEQFGWLMG